MKDFSKLLLKLFLRFVLKIYYIFPISKKRIFFMATMGKGYSCNPKYIYESMIKDSRFIDFEFVWCFLDCDKWKDYFLNSSNTKMVSRKNFILYFYYLLTSRVIVYNCGGFSYAPIRKKQFLIETWHGGGAFKKMGLVLNNKSWASKYGIRLASRDIKLFLSSCSYGSENVIRSAMGYNGRILDCGSPRNDLFFRNNNVANIKKKLGIDNKTKIVLYAPTFKGKEDSAVNIDNSFEIIDPYVIKKTLSNRFGGNWLFLSRGHQYAGELFLNGVDLNVSYYPDMQELLLVSDVLITDYSSSLWDFGLLDKPCFLFTPDLDNYINSERGFFLDIYKWPGLVCKTNSDLISNIKSFDSSKYLNQIHLFYSDIGSYEKGTACNIVLDEIAKELSRK